MEKKFKEVVLAFDKELSDFKAKNSINTSIYDYYKPIIHSTEQLSQVGNYGVIPPDYIKVLFQASLELAKRSAL